MIDKSQMTEEEIKLNYITLAILEKWSKTSIRMEYYFTSGRITIDGKKAVRGEANKADYLLYYGDMSNNFPIAIVEAKDNNHSPLGGLPQAIKYAIAMDVPFAFASNGDSFTICYCQRCGDIYQRIKNNQSASWKCATRGENGPTACDAPLVPERELHNAVLRGINMVLSGRDNMMTKLRENIEWVLLEESSATIDEIDAKLETLQQKLIKRAGAKQDYEDLADEIDALRTKRLEAMTEKAEREGLKVRIKEMQDFLESQTDRSSEYDEQLVRKMIEKITICDEKFVIEFKSGTTLDVRR